jgi:hypothetical protein
MSHKSCQTTMSTWSWRLDQRVKDKHLYTSSSKLLVVTKTCSIKFWTMGTDRIPFYKTQVLTKFNNICFRFKPQKGENKKYKIKNIQFGNYAVHQLLSVNNFHRYIFIFIVAPCISKIHLSLHTNKCSNIIYYVKSVLIKIKTLYSLTATTCFDTTCVIIREHSFFLAKITG